MKEEMAIFKIFIPGKEKKCRMEDEAFKLREDILFAFRKAGLTKKVQVAEGEPMEFCDASCFPYIEIKYSDVEILHEIIDVLKEMKIGMRVYYSEMNYYSAEEMGAG